MPYAHGATIEHEFDVDHLNVWLTFRHPMDQDVKPAHNLWTLTVDDVEKAISASAWQDEFTLLIVSDAVVVYPDRVLLSYEGPSGNLQTTWGKDWEPWGDALSFDIGKGKCFVDRGDPAIFDFDQTDFITDATWRDLDLSGIVPAKATAILLYCRIKDGFVGSNLRFRKKGNVNFGNTTLLYTQTANIYISVDGVCPIDTNRFIQYYGGPIGLDDIGFLVKGWFF